MSFTESFREMIERGVHGAGMWVIVRAFSSVHSKYWDERAQESVGGPAFEYTDTILLASKQPAMEVGRPGAQVGLQVEQQSNLVIDTYRYFLTPDVTIKEDDEIFDLDSVGNQPTDVDYENVGTGAKILGRYKVKSVIPYRVNRGELVYQLAIAKRNYAE